MNQSLTLLKKNAGMLGAKSIVVTLIVFAYSTFNNRLVAQNRAVKLDHISFALGHTLEKQRATTFFQTILGATQLTTDANNTSILEFELCPGSPVIRVFKKETPEPSEVCNFSKSVDKWESCVSNYGMIWTTISTPNLKRTIKDLKAAGFPIKMSKTMLPQSPNVEVAITSPFNNQLILLVQKTEGNDEYCKIENVQLVVENLRKSLSFYEDTMGASDITFINEFTAQANIGGNTFILAEPEGLVLNESNFNKNGKSDSSLIKEHFSFLFEDLEQNVYAINGKGYFFKNTPVPQYRDNKHSHFSNGQILSPDGLIIDLGDLVVSRYSRQ
ncbi:VOC family protein [Flectobacillus major]|uniref:VOC family protein n=1 Tax=Flectobacillus major TaxID=103 RepID=UPI0004005D18|nr:VOC family protein [Flectobacillus major]